MTLPQLHLATWDEIESKVEEYRDVFKDLNNYLFIDYETFYSDEYSLRKKDMTYLKYVRHEFFKIQSAFIKRGDCQKPFSRLMASISVRRSGGLQCLQGVSFENSGSSSRS